MPGAVAALGRVAAEERAWGTPSRPGPRAVAAEEALKAARLGGGWFRVKKL